MLHLMHRSPIVRLKREGITISISLRKNVWKLNYPTFTEIFQKAPLKKHAFIMEYAFQIKMSEWIQIKRLLNNFGAIDRVI